MSDTKMGRAFWAAVLLHLLLLIPLLWHWTSHAPTVGNSRRSERIISAVAVDQEAIHQQVEQLKQAEAKREAAVAAQEQHLKHVQQEAERINQEKLAQEEHLKQLQDTQKKLEEQQALKKAEKNTPDKKALPEPKHPTPSSVDKKSTPTKTRSEKKKVPPAETPPSKKARAASEQNTASHAAESTERSTPQASSEHGQQEAQRIQGELGRYQQLILAAIERRWIIPDGVTKDRSAQLLVRLAPGGVVLDVQVLRSSGMEALDQSAVTAVYKSSPLPVPEEADLFYEMRTLKLTVRPEGLLQ